MYICRKKLKREVRIGTRGSKLALWQANYLQDELAKIGLTSSIHIIKTKGDAIQDLSFDKIEGKGFFTKEIEEALLQEEVDLAVHSMKDLPTTSPEGLVITAVSYREDPTDWLIVRKEVSVKNKLLRLPVGAVVGTSSARRKAQLLHFRSDFVLKDIRGNVPTRIDKLRQGQFDAIVLAFVVSTAFDNPLSLATLIPKWLALFYLLKVLDYLKYLIAFVGTTLHLLY